GRLRPRAGVGADGRGCPPAPHNAHPRRPRHAGGRRLHRGAARPPRACRPMILAIDQGTTGTTCLVVDETLRPVGRGYREVEQHFPQPGWVEHDPEELWRSVEGAAADALAATGMRATDLAAIGITNQRETTVLWDRATGRPVARAIVWQDRRTADRCRELPAGIIRERTGLVPDPDFSATKLEWRLAPTDIPPERLDPRSGDSRRL